MTDWPRMITSQTEPSGIARASRIDVGAWFTPGRFAALLAALIVVTFFRVVSGQETFFYRDFGGFGYPLAYYHREAFWRGELPLWNPLNNCGLPFLAQWNTLTLYPLSLFYLLFPLSWSLGVFNLGHLFLAGLGMYYLARQWTGNGLAASFAGLAFAFNGLSWQSLMWPNNIVALGWMPWVVWTVERAWREGGRHVIVAALAGAMQMLSGAPEIIFLTWMFAGVSWLAGAISTPNSRASIFARFVAVLLLVTALSAAQLLPFLDLLAHSHRDTGFGDSAWAMPRSGLANYLVPLFRCTANNQGVFGQVDQYWTASYYMGIGTVALALLAVWRARDKMVWLAAAMAAWGLLMALGDHGFIYPALKAVFPPLGFMRFPIKFAVLPTLLIPLLAADGLAQLQALRPEDWPRERKRLVILALVFTGLILAIVWTAWKYPRPAEDWTATWRNAAGRALFLALILAAVALLVRGVKIKMKWPPHVALLLLLWLDVYTHAPKINPTVEPSVYQPGLVRASLKWDQ
ncbi:MAG TPA: YfhO family protein, partial [Verrucomicrobiae bacterium]|nr:YfhO family protein [Verrucomicrobiae bacterium]